MAEKIDFSSVISRWAIRACAPDTDINSLARPLLGKIHDFRRAATGEIARLKRIIKEAHASGRAEASKLKVALTEQKDNVDRLRDEMSRKNKILSSLRTAKTSDENSVEQWKNEARESEEKTRRLQQVLRSKDSMIRDLKAKLEDYDSAIDTGSAAGKKAAAEVTGPIISDLKYRLKQSELEKGRIKKTLKELADRSEQLEKEFPVIKEQVMTQ